MRFSGWSKILAHRKRRDGEWGGGGGLMSKSTRVKGEYLVKWVVVVMQKHLEHSNNSRIDKVGRILALYSCKLKFRMNWYNYNSFTL